MSIEIVQKDKHHPYGSGIGWVGGMTGMVKWDSTKEEMENRVILGKYLLEKIQYIVIPYVTISYITGNPVYLSIYTHMCIHTQTTRFIYLS